MSIKLDQKVFAGVHLTILRICRRIHSWDYSIELKHIDARKKKQKRKNENKMENY